MTLSPGALAPLAYDVLSEAVGPPMVFVTLGVFSFATVPLCWPLAAARAAKYPTPSGG